MTNASPNIRVLIAIALTALFVIFAGWEEPSNAAELLSCRRLLVPIAVGGHLRPPFTPAVRHPRFPLAIELPGFIDWVDLSEEAVPDIIYYMPGIAEAFVRSDAVGTLSFPPGFSGPAPVLSDLSVGFFNFDGKRYVAIKEERRLAGVPFDVIHLLGPISISDPRSDEELIHATLRIPSFLWPIEFSKRLRYDKLGSTLLYSYDLVLTTGGPLWLLEYYGDAFYGKKGGLGILAPLDAGSKFHTRECYLPK